MKNLLLKNIPKSTSLQLLTTFSIVKKLEDDVELKNDIFNIFREVGEYNTQNIDFIEEISNFIKLDNLN